MIIRYDPDFLEILRKTKVNIRKSFKGAIFVFSNNPNHPQLNNHSLRGKWDGYRSIDVTDDWRAIYTEKSENLDTVAYFVAIGTHSQLYK